MPKSQPSLRHGQPKSDQPIPYPDQGPPPSMMTAGASCPHAYLGSSLFQSKDVRGAQYSLFLFCARATRVGPPDHSHDRITSQSTVDHTTRPFQTLRPSTPSQFECVVCVYSYVVEQRLELWCARPHVPYSEVVPRRRHQVARCAHGPLLRTPHHLGRLMETSACRSESTRVSL